MPRFKDKVWNLPDQPDYPAATLGLLMDIRDELQRLNALLHCGNFTSIPNTLRTIERHTRRRKRVTTTNGVKR